MAGENLKNCRLEPRTGTETVPELAAEDGRATRGRMFSQSEGNNLMIHEGFEIEWNAQARQNCFHMRLNLIIVGALDVLQINHEIKTQ
jgi:hypothetical protein